jgi:hypothetical protein
MKGAWTALLAGVAAAGREAAGAAARRRFLALRLRYA